MRPRLSAIFCVALLGNVCMPAAAATFTAAANAISSNTAMRKTMDSYLQTTFKPGLPGAAVLVLRDGQPVFKKAYGKASLELNVAMQTDAVFHVASVSKQFTGAALLKLAEQGKLDVQAPVSQYLPDTPPAWAAMTLSHLASHTSGIPNLYGLPIMQPRLREDLAPAELFAIARELPLLAAPGSQFHYATINYTLLAMVISKVAGQPYEAYVDEQFIQPLGLKHTVFSIGNAVVPGLVTPYAAGPATAPYLSHHLGYGGGSYYSNASDIARWTLALQDGKVLSPASLALMNTPYKLTDGKQVHYGYGLRPHTLNKAAYIQSNGDIPGFHSETVYLPAKRVFVAVLHNGEGVARTGLQGMVKRLALIATGQAYQAPKAIAFDTAKLAAYVGLYQNGGETGKITLEKGKLYAAFSADSPAMPISALSATEFFYDDNPDFRLRFVLREGKAISAHWVEMDALNDEQDAVLLRVETLSKSR
ncbi:serine hydrolase [Undibacterium pigrum]|uniref:Serine beta-lactamase-like protein LACTB n=1 Tax=Undibacterium pigrum TaxID=401470 RepID=A0A318JME6_9BURK|nr:serine hydrolase [Undibacterium pigrum]PXX41432.1 serine beta-lactamase-like protein LACTB [Undibacterium pigrum]